MTNEMENQVQQLAAMAQVLEILCFLRRIRHRSKLLQN